MKTKGSIPMTVLGISATVKYLYEYSPRSVDTPESYDVEILRVSYKGNDIYNVLERYDSIYPKEEVIKGIKDYVINEHTQS